MKTILKNEKNTLGSLTFLIFQYVCTFRIKLKSLSIYFLNDKVLRLFILY